MIYTPARPPRDRRRGLRRPAARWAIGAALALVIFGLGVAFGQALEEGPGPGEPKTRVRTISPGTVPVVPRETDSPP